jgi:hypothetical protein
VETWSDGEEIGSDVEDGETEEELDQRTEGKITFHSLIQRDASCPGSGWDPSAAAVWCKDVG